MKFEIKELFPGTREKRFWQGTVNMPVFEAKTKSYQTARLVMVRQEAPGCTTLDKAIILQKRGAQAKEPCQPKLVAKREQKGATLNHRSFLA